LFFLPLIFTNITNWLIRPKIQGCSWLYIFILSFFGGLPTFCAALLNMFCEFSKTQFKIRKLFF